MSIYTASIVGVVISRLIWFGLHASAHKLGNRDRLQTIGKTNGCNMCVGTSTKQMPSGQETNKRRKKELRNHGVASCATPMSAILLVIEQRTVLDQQHQT